MKKNKLFLGLVISTIILTNLSFAQQRNGNEVCYPDGCVNLANETGSTGQSATNYSSLSDFLKVVYDVYTGHGISGEKKDDKGRYLFLGCDNGASVSLTWKGCDNGAQDYPTCSVCAPGASMQNNNCVCTNGATNAPMCNQCPAGQGIYNDLCMCANGAIDVPTCQQCGTNATMQGGQCVCGNGAVPQTNCSACPTGKAMYHDKCVDACDITNVCGLAAKGILVEGACTLPGDLDVNASCISTFTVDTDHVNPDGSAEFTWATNPKIPSTIGSRCGFVDLTTPTARPIPGLQDLDPKRDKVRISNIQATTRFCLICQFYKLLDQSVLGNAAAHQWVKVIKVGEN